MAAWEDDDAAGVIRRAAAVGVNVITNPPTNLMLQGREDREPRRRGIPRIKELLSARVTIAAGQDCVDDAFYPFGNADPLQVVLIVAHAAELGTPTEIAAAMRMVGEDAARVLRLPDYGLIPGARADLVVLDAERPADALREQAPRSNPSRWLHVCPSFTAAAAVRTIAFGPPPPRWASIAGRLSGAASRARWAAVRCGVACSLGPDAGLGRVRSAGLSLRLASHQPPPRLSRLAATG